MLSRETIIRRLAIIKYLYKVGFSQSQQPETVAFASLLSFHDAIEIFLKLAAEKENIKSDNFSFLEYWDKIPGMTLKESMRYLNQRRVNLKHKGILPAKQDLEISRVNVTDFFEQNTKVIFGIDFKDISMINLVSDASARKFLEIAQQRLEENNLQDCIENTAFAFYDLLENYEKNKTDLYRKSPFYFGDDTTFWHSSTDVLRDLNRELADNINKIKTTVDALKESMKIMCMGIDYRKYSMFKLLTPRVSKYNDGKHFAQLPGDQKWDKENCQFCIDFVIGSSLKLQEFDFNINHLMDYDTPELEYVSGDFDSGIVFKEKSK